MHTKQHRTSFPTLHRASTSLPAQSYHLPEHRACNRTQSFNNLSGNLLIKNSHPKQSSVLLQEIPLQHRVQNTTEHKACNLTQSFSPAGTQCLPPPYTIHRAYAIFRDASAHKAPHHKQSSVLFHPPCTELSPSGTQSFTSHPSR